MNLIQKIVCIAVAVLGMMQAHAEEGGLLETLSKWNTFQAHFVQIVCDERGVVNTRVEGYLAMTRKNQFYWKSLPPDPVLIVADGKWVWTYDITLAQITRQKLESILSHSPALLLMGDLSLLKKQFHIQPIKCQGKGSCFELLAREKDSPYERVRLVLEGGSLKRIVIQDALGHEVRIVFSNVLINRPIPSKQFRFSVPSGVDVIEEKGAL